MQAIVLANGDFLAPPDLSDRLAAADLFIAANGGAQHCRALGLRPDVIIGDLDSLDASTRADWETQGVRIISYPVEKDQTDLELAMLYAKGAGAEKILVLGGLGRRWDHSFANLLLAAHPQFDGVSIIFLHGDQRLFIIKGKLHLQAATGDRASLLPLGGDAKEVTTRGLKYPLKGETLIFGSSRGVSNVVISEDAEVELQSGILLCVISPS
ncbi:MAG: thiamine diphosphokinase [Chloroflexi bacterium]|nr:thiamine diphosphokinase [Chloroflexota bacterium]